MLKLVSDEKIPADPLFTCLSAVLRFYRMPADMSVLAAEMASYEDQWSMADLPAVSDYLGLELQITSFNIEEIRDTEKPLIIPLEDDQFALVLPIEGGTNDWILPGATSVALTDEHLALWNGERVISLIPDESRIAANSGSYNSLQRAGLFWTSIGRYVPNLREVAVSTMLGNVLLITLSLSLWVVFDSVDPSMGFSTITLLAAGTGLIFALDVYFKTTRTSKLQRITQDTSARLESELMTRTLSSWHDKNDLSVVRTAELFAQTQKVRSFYATRLVPAIMDSSFFFVFLFAIFFVSPFLALIPLATSIALLGLGLLLKEPVSNSAWRKYQLNQEKSTLTHETLAACDCFHQIDGSDGQLSRWYDASERAAKLTSENNQWLCIGRHGSVALAQLSLVLTVIVGIGFIQAGSLSVAGLIASVLLSIPAVSSALSLYSSTTNWSHSIADLKNIEELLVTKNESGEGHLANSFNGSIEFKDFSYTYPDQSDAVVSAINLTIQSGENICLFGPTGAGKSTLARAIAGKVLPSNGEICIDGTDYRYLSPASLSENVVLVSSNPFFFKGTLRDNLILGNNDISDDTINEAIRISGLGLVFSDPVTQLDMSIASNGSNLSDGQKQAISMTQAVLRDAPVLVLDEPTKGLDSALADNFKQSIKNYSKGRTLIMLTSDTSLASLADRVIVLEKGTIKTDDTTDVVMNKLSA